ncbi:alpha/beta fold hydrolase [Neomesorhizobium albiziae]|uniref:alpha/beta fold hydrolase n=1 Tax=Neomesorhizobium albiziae TaxID=335020 RepID=UPI00122C52FD|nr:alpha/beta fold hydrolase [Mesorhizobium albiziae]
MVDEQGTDFFDVLIVGSGYGGAVAAAELGGCVDDNGKLSVCVLERGQEYMAGMFPSRMSELPGHVRFVTPGAKRQSGTLDGLYDLRWSADAVALMASGLGGGSLINAGVMEMPIRPVFAEAGWPKGIRDDTEAIFSLSQRVSDYLGAVRFANEIPKQLDKTNALRELHSHTFNKLQPEIGEKLRPATFKETHVTIAANPGDNHAGVTLDPCLLCGDCATGCNHNAKNSLDLNLLVRASNAGVKMVTGATVLRIKPIERGQGGWLIEVNHTDAHLRDRQPKPFVLRARRVILAAGTFGSTEILKRSHDDITFPISPQVGRRFSANGDMIAVAYGLGKNVNAVADEATDPLDPNVSRSVGPTITAMIDLREGNPETDVVIQDLAVPGPLRRLFEESTTTFDAINNLVSGDWSKHRRDRPRPDTASVNPDAIRDSLVLAMIARDSADGELVMADRNPHDPDNADGMLTVRWPELRLDSRFAKQHEMLATLIKPTGGRLVNNLLWRPLSEKLEGIFGRQRGPSVTVHPLGGCAMGSDFHAGVTNQWGQVFIAEEPGDPTVDPATFEGLAVLDGSIIPTSLGINPALTIATLALRALGKLKEAWQLTGGGLTEAENGSAAKSGRRPAFVRPTVDTEPVKTQIELTEQVRGCVTLYDGAGNPNTHEVELTLTTEPVEIARLLARDTPKGGRCMRIAPGRVGQPGKGRLRILRKRCSFDAVSDEVDEATDVAMVAEISGTLSLFALEDSGPIRRITRSFWAWINNRGMRDIAHSVIRARQRRLRLMPPHMEKGQPWWRYFVDIFLLLTHSGGMRLVEYDLRIDNAKVLHDGELDAAHFKGRAIRGVKRLTYARFASPWTQAMEMTLEKFPDMTTGIAGTRPKLTLNKRYLAKQSVPLIRVVDQQDGIAAWIDLFSLALYGLRVLLEVHSLSFRKPDAPADREPQRLPGALPGIGSPQIDWLTVDGSVAFPVRIRLARYDGSGRKPGCNIPQRPVLLIHGYSASGTTFAHPAVPGNLVETLYNAGRDVWVLDLRTSAGLPTATGDWPFEVMAEKDIPIAIDRVLETTNAGRVDVVAHCMGAAMFSMAMLGVDEPDTELQQVPKVLAQGKLQKRFPFAENMPRKIGRVVFSQVGPAMLMSPSNILAAYLMRYVRFFLSLEKYEFSPRGELPLTDQLLDRGLAAMGVTPEEFRRENPRWPLGKATPWVGTRHRMDALYANTFALKNVSDEVLDHLDDFFGAISVQTISQVIHFVGYNTVTDRDGINRYVLPSRVQERLQFPMMSIHGKENGLVDPATLALMRNLLAASNVRYLNGLAEAVEQTLPPEAMKQLIETAAGPHLVLDRASYLTWLIDGHGHQDCLIGKHAGSICDVIAHYLGQPDAEKVEEVQAMPQKPGISRVLMADYAVDLATAKAPFPFVARAPALGVSVSVRRNKIRIAAADTSGSGVPLGAWILPVEPRKGQADKLQRRMPKGSESAQALEPLYIGLEIKREDLSRGSKFPYTFEASASKWPRSKQVLLLLIYHQAEGIGGTARHPEPASAAHAISPMLGGALHAECIDKALRCDRLDQLRGGLIDSGPLGELHDLPTLQKDSAQKVTFALASCQYPSDILNAMPNGVDATPGPADRSLLSLGDRLGLRDSPTLLLLAGDQIYTDATAGLFDPKILDEKFRIPHERRAQSRGVNSVRQNFGLRVEAMLDDHEISDNWAPNDPDPNADPDSDEIAESTLKRGRRAYFRYERGILESDNVSIWRSFVHEGFPFFLSDTRTRRGGRNARNWRRARIMGERQFQSLCSWMLAQPADRPKFVLTPSLLLPRRLCSVEDPGRALHSDVWEGYPRSMHRLLKFISDERISNLVFLSGDEHLGMTAEITLTSPQGDTVTVHSVHSAALYSPFPFANGITADFNEPDGFDFREVDWGPKPYHCEVTASFHPGDGFTIVTASQSPQGWELDVCFHNAAGKVKQNGVRRFILCKPATESSVPSAVCEPAST